MEWIKKVADRWWSLAGVGPADGADGIIATVGTDVLVYQSTVGLFGHGHSSEEEAINCAYGAVTGACDEGPWTIATTWQKVPVARG